ncbi:unnamed protein product [Arabis nemorensis]|uniref:Uncharacterized protein n=1 Tax=Arabis nemorensis TaxID=586526 RepID=A0A565C0T6_9BRAS|nr:unnamed protein product [Arabis nemorensis]
MSSFFKGFSGSSLVDMSGEVVAINLKAGEKRSHVTMSLPLAAVSKCLEGLKCIEDIENLKLELFCYLSDL